MGLLLTWVYCTVQLGANYHQNNNNHETFKCLNTSTEGLTLQGTNFISHVVEKLKQYVTITTILIMSLMATPRY